jgi:hypothetical protein
MQSSIQAFLPLFMTPAKTKTNGSSMEEEIPFEPAPVTASSMEPVFEVD